MINKFKYLLLALLAALAVGTPTSAGIIQLVPKHTPSGGGGGDPPGTGDIFNDNFEDRSTDADLTLGDLGSAPWTTLGYVAGNSELSNAAVIARASFPAGLLASPDLHASKTRAVYHNLTQEAQGRLFWELPDPVSSFCISWWEYRPNNNFAAEKFMRAGNFIGENRGNDIIWSYGGPEDDDSGLPWFNLFQQGPEPNFDTGYSSSDQDVSGLHHYEGCVTLSTDTNSNGTMDLWVDGVRESNATGLQFFDGASDDDRGLQFVDFGGWPSGQPLVYLNMEYPIERYFLEWKLNSTRMGVWAMSAD